MLVKQLLNAICGIFLFTSCGTMYYYADFIKPSDVYVPTATVQVGLLNRGAAINSEAIVYVNGSPAEYIPELPKMIGDQTLTTLKKTLDELKRFELTEIDNPAFQISDRAFMRQAYSTAQVDSICALYGLDGFVCIDGIDLAIKTDGEVNVVTATDQFGNPVRVPEFTQEQTFEYNVGWRFYLRGAEKPIDVFDETYYGYFNQTGYSPNMEMESDTRNARLKSLAFQAAAEYHNRISPYWEESYRLYYRSEGEMMQISQNLEYNGNWEAAASQWLKLTTSEDLTTRYEAKYNMAVASEMLGRPRLAKEWLEKAIADKHTKQADKYMAILEKQILIYDVIDAQLGM